MNSLSKKIVVAAMSGGVDSSVAALLLKQQGYEVIGISMKTHESMENEGCSAPSKTCCTVSDIMDARRVCQLLDVPFYAMNYVEAFHDKVVDYFGREYAAGRTPNPCVACNHHLKFDALLKHARQLGAYYLATGHYAQKIRDEQGMYRLLKSRDDHKDQTYFLYGLGQEQLEHTLFPIGHLTKDEVRDIARRAGLKTADKPESQEICFVPNNDYAGFIENHLPQYRGTPGDFVDEEGKVLGAHRGIHAYTVGQRRGLGVATGDRVYVSAILTEKNQVVLSSKESLLMKGFTTVENKWVNRERVADGMEIEVKVRHRVTASPAFLLLETPQKVRVQFKSPEGAVTPGQSAVFYCGDEVLGGGFIEAGYR